MLKEEQIERYARHILLREVGGVGQKRLLDAAVRVEGLGQVGSWACLYLALAGVGRLALQDSRSVPEAGLPPLLSPADAGELRARALARVLEDHNPDVRWEVSAEGPSAVADECLLSAEGELRLFARASGAALWIGWVEGPPCARCFPEDPPLPEAAALAGSLAASRLLGQILFDEAAPGLLRIEGGEEEVVPPCPHR